jgi:hypothetical protein
MKADKIIGAVQGVTQKWAKQRKQEERQASAELRRYDAMTRRRRTTIREAAWEVMEAAYLKASAGGTLPAHARQIMYAARGHIQEITGRRLDDQYFCQTLLPDYVEEKGRHDWDVVFDARGHFNEPHTNLVVPLGTLEVRSYLRAIEDHELGEVIDLSEPKIFATCGPEHRYSGVLFIEKEGFMPLFRAVKLAETHDLAIMSTKGLSVTASRHLVDELCGDHDIPLMVLHDFDKSGFSIVGTLQRDTRRYEFMNSINVIDLGLRLEDIEGLEAEDVVYQSDPKWNLSENGATAEEIEFLRGSNHGGRTFYGRRVELNAFDSRSLVDWISSKLAAHGIAKVIPNTETLETTWRRAIAAQHFDTHSKALVKAARKRAAETNPPADIEDRIRRVLKRQPTLSWDAALRRIARGKP